jgi:spore coat polysaccharide biosynthesis protein SpsF
MIIAILQARYSSKRLRGKVLKKIGKKTILEMVYNNLKNAKVINKVIIATSKNKEDDKIYNFCKKKKIICFRGSLRNIGKRYFDCLNHYSCHAFLRICCDSPFIKTNIINKCIKIFQKKDFDIVTNIFPRSFPKGQSIEVINSRFFIRNFKKIDKRLCENQFTDFFYQNAKNYRIFNLKNKKNLSRISMAIDTKNDLKNAKKNFQMYSRYL